MFESLTKWNPFKSAGSATPYFEAAGHGRKLRSFRPSKKALTAALEASGSTLLARARWLYENDGLAGNAVDEWASHATGDGIKPRPKWKDEAAKKREALELFWDWTEEADADGNTDYFGLQEKVARETYLAGECFVRIRARRPGDVRTVPFQLQMLPAEMLDLNFNATLENGNYIRCGIEFNQIGQRVAYHFWRWHPNDRRPTGSGVLDRRRVPAEQVIHVFEGRNGGQIRGVPRVARILVKIFGLEMYDDAELDRKKTAALFTAFLIGRGENPILDDRNADDPEEEEAPIQPMESGAIVDLGDDKDVKFSNPTEVGGSYEAFQYRNLLKICAGLGIPYSIVTGDVTRGNFSNVRTSIIQFRRRIAQYQSNVLIFQFCQPVWRAFIERAVLSGRLDLPGYESDPMPYWRCDHLPPRLEWIDPQKDVAAEKEQIRAGLKSSDLPLSFSSTWS